jgi:uncharacterized protein
VAGRNHDLVLHARIAGYDPAWTEALLYDERRLFEAYNKGLSILPTEELPWYRVSWDRMADRHGEGAFAEHRELVDALLERIRVDGPIRTIDLERMPAIDWYWGPTSPGRALLEALAEAGILGLARREGNRRAYDLLERLHDPALLAVRPLPREQLRHKLLSRYRGHGLLGASGSGELWGGLTKRQGLDGEEHPSRVELLAELVEMGALFRVGVDGLRGLRHVVASDAGCMERAIAEVAQGLPPGGAAPAVTFLAPLDPLAWDRELLRSLFGFDYVWEVYVPEVKRPWGYYVLPVLFGDRFVGRIEPRIDRASRKVRVLGIAWEPGFDPLVERGFVEAFAAALDAYRRFARAGAVTWPRTRAAQRFARDVRSVGVA